MHVQAQIVQVFEGKPLSMFAPEAEWFERTRQPDPHEIGPPHGILPNPPDKGRVPSICAVKPASRGVEQTSLSLPATPNPSVPFHPIWTAGDLPSRREYGGDRVMAEILKP